MRFGPSSLAVLLLLAGCRGSSPAHQTEMAVGSGGNAGSLPAGQGGSAAAGGTGGAAPDAGELAVAGSSGVDGTGGADAAVDHDAGPGALDAQVPIEACGDGLTLAPGDSSGTVRVGNVDRTYLLHVPPGYDGSTRMPLVIDFHPLFGTGTSERNGSGYLQLSDSKGFVVAFPNGIDNAWNIGPCCTQSRSVDDLGFAKALVAELLAKGCLDPKRVYATGFSMGGGMSHFLACNAAEVFAAVAPSAFDLLAENEEPCHPARPISVISFRGTADAIVPYAGGASNPPNGLPVTIHFRGAQATFEHWAMLDGCTGTPTDSGGGCETYTACDANVEVTLCTSASGHVTGDAQRGWSTLERFHLP